MTATTRSLRCPTCDSPQPGMHPAVSGGGEAVPCRDQWHADYRAYIPRSPRCAHCGSQAVAAIGGVQACNDCGMTGAAR